MTATLVLVLLEEDVVVPKGKATTMMGCTQRHFAPLVNVSLEDLVPADHFSRHLERALDRTFVREFVQQTSACGGRPSIDPAVFFKLPLVMFFEGLRVSTATDAACGGSAKPALVLRVGIE